MGIYSIRIGAKLGSPRGSEIMGVDCYGCRLSLGLFLLIIHIKNDPNLRKDTQEAYREELKHARRHVSHLGSKSLEAS